MKIWRVILIAMMAIPLGLMAQSVSVSPSGYIAIPANATVQFSATVTGLSSTSVVWLANNVIGGNATAGTISTTGLYTAPANIPNGSVQITAVSSVSTKTKNSQYVYFLAQGPVITQASPNPLPTGQFNVTLTVTGLQANAVVFESFSTYSQIALSTVSTTATTITANGYHGSPSSGTFFVRNPGSDFSAPFVVPVQPSGPVKYSLTVVNGTGSGSYLAGTVVAIKANTGGVGQVFANWTGAGIANPNAASTSVTMGSANATVTANYNQVATYPLTVVGGSGSGNYPAGTVVAVNANAAPVGQAFASWTGTVANATVAATSVTMPAAATTVTANYLAIPVPAITDITVPTIPLGVFSFLIDGQNFTATSKATLGTTALSTSFVSANQLSVSGFVSQSGPSTITVTNASVTSAPLAVTVGVANAYMTSSAARRFLQQAAFGPTSTEAAHLQAIGYPAWLAAQFAQPQVSNYNGLGSQSGMPNRFLSNAVNNPDQLRQRVAFALSQIFVISINKVIWNEDQQVFQEMLMKDAFVNYRQILQDVTLSPGMGDFLDMANNGKANAAGTVLPNENYAREVMQLFSVGTFLLNQDGSKQLDASNNPIPTYQQPNISEMARVFTGWTYPRPGGAQPFWGSYIDSADGPMVAIQSYHDTGAKSLLHYTPLPGTNPPMSLPAGQSAQQDLAGAMDNLFYHPNTGPFIGRLLIQHLVKSNPTPLYVGRVAAAFNDNGHGVRGDMTAVVTAILTDPEARANDLPGQQQAKDGHLQEPVLFLAGFLRAMNAQVTDQNYYSYDLSEMGQDIYNAPSVFNYYSPGYVVPSFGVGGPEFQIYTPYTSVFRDNVVSGLFAQYSNPVQNYGPGTTVDLTPFMALASNPSTMVDALDLSLTCGLMPAGLKTILVNAVTAETGGALRQAQTAIYLLLSSGYYNVWN